MVFHTFWSAFMFFFLYFFLLGTIVDIFAKYRSSLDIEQSWLTYSEKWHTLKEKNPRKKFQLFKRAQMEGKLYQSRPRSVAHSSKKPKSKPRDENGSSLDHKKVWSRESNNGRQKQQRHERGSSILRKDQKKKGGRGEVDYDFQVQFSIFNF